jgi:signal transduction histidine kinase
LEPEQIVAIKDVITLVKTTLTDKIVMLVLVNLMIVIIISLFFSHQIAGPIYKIEMTLRKIRKGNLEQRFFFRKSDRLDELAEQLNATMEHLTRPILKTEEALKKLETLVKDGEAKLVIDELIGEFESLRTVVTEEDDGEEVNEEKES